ncbi:response regulator [Paenibacillus aurantius]|uniref:Response regulator n=1 Tax=Paenibacillus aurantius TaxID=2918900 RepID=A0AA96RI09_9BACL|nr:response regulator [Paenibacillus aurantius]WNQ13948.1 response regulator [Paenibacillus aurantius]
MLTLNLLIVEDEIRLRNALVHNIPWEEHGIEIVGQAGNGREALTLIDRRRPDILLLDLQMPEMDGLSLAKRLRETDPLLQIIVLSGHDDFEYAQKALELGVMKYLLKPAGDEEILGTVLEAAERLRKEWDRRHNSEEIRKKWMLHLPHLVEEFIKGWLEGKYESWELEQKGRDLQLELTPDTRYTVAVIDMDPLSEDETRFSHKDAPLLQFSLNSIVKETFQRVACWVASDATGATVIIFRHGEGEDSPAALQKTNALAEKALNSVLTCLKLTASAGISGTTGVAEEMNKLYLQAVRALQNRIVLGDNLAIPYREEAGEAASVTPQPNHEKMLEIALETGDGERAMEAVEAMWTDGMNKAESVETMQEQILYFASLFVRIIQKQGWRVKEVAGDDYSYFHNHGRFTAREQFLAWTTRMVRAYLGYANQRRKRTSNETIAAILDLVENEMDQEMMLHTIADRLYVNSSYLSRLFKQETGKAFSAYVLERKMERAKAHLQDGGRIMDVAAAVGYRDVSYFTRVFRKYWGVTPGEIRGQ